MRGHLTPAEAGEHAPRAGVKRVLLTHVSDELDELWARSEAERGVRRAGRGRPRGRRLRRLSRVRRRTGTFGACLPGARPLRQLRAHAPRDRRAVRRRLRPLGARAAQRAGFSPAVDVYYAGDPPSAVVTGRPGRASTSTSSGSRSAGASWYRRRAPRRPSAEGRVYQQIEIEHGPFRREIQLGADVVADEARATYEDGILRVELPLARARASARAGADRRSRDERRAGRES